MIIKEYLKIFIKGITEVNKDQIIDIVYYSYLVLHYDELEILKKEVSELFNPLTDDILLSNVGAVYYEDFDKYVDFICNKKPLDDAMIIEWMKSNSRERTYNKMLNRIVKVINIDGNNLDLINSFKEELQERLPKETKDKYELSKLNKEQLEILVKSFLIKIDKEKNLLNKYNYLKNNNKIIFNGNKNNNINSNSYVENKTIYITLNETTYDFPVLIHEFFHIINNKSTNSTLLNELLSIYYEEEAINYLEEIGYSKKECNELRRIREDALIRNINKIERIWKHLIKYQNDSKITTSDIIKEIKEEGNNIVKDIKRTKEIDTILENISYKEESKKRIDQETILLIKNASLLIYFNSYIIGYYFTKMLEDIDNKEDIINYYINHKNELTLQEIFEIIKKNKKELRR